MLKRAGSLLAGTDRHDKCVVHRLCSRSIPCPLDSGLDSAYWDEVEAIRAAAMGVRQVDGRKKKPDKPKVTVTKKGKKGSKGSLPRGVDPPVSTSQLVVQDDSELSCSIASCGSEVSAAVCNTSTIVGTSRELTGLAANMSCLVPSTISRWDLVTVNMSYQTIPLLRSIHYNLTLT